MPTLCLGVVKTITGGSCVFPFYLYGQEYNECTDDDGAHAKWCCTEVTEESEPACDYWKKDWGYCAKEC